MFKTTLTAAALAAAFFAAPALVADTAWANCSTTTAKDDLTAAETNELYACLKEKLREGYASQGGAFTKEYQEWKAVSTGPGVAGSHGNRFLMTYVNETGFSEYVKYSDERGPMPVGSVLAKESFNINKKGEAQHGPLFIMEKVADGGEAAEFGNWVYTAFQPNGKPMGIKQAFCHDCHGAFDTQDAMGYPLEELRLAAD